jgi:hypothetical protein
MLVDSKIPFNKKWKSDEEKDDLLKRHCGNYMEKCGAELPPKISEICTPHMQIKQ